MTRRQKLSIFSVLLAVLMAFTVLFASGVLRFGLSGPAVYVLYIIAGFTAAVLTFGLLTSSGTLTAHRHGTTLTLGGSIIALVVVVGGGGLYEKYLHQSESFDLLVAFWSDDPNSLAPLSGEVILFAGNNDFSQRLDGTGRVRFLGLPSHLLGRPLTFALSSPGFQVVKSEPSVFSRDSPIRVEVRRAQTYADPASALEISLAKAQVVDYAPRPDQRIVTFTLRMHSKAGLPLPLESTARFRILSESGAPMWEIPLNAEASFVIAEPGLSIALFEAVIDRSSYESLAGGRLGEIVVQYERSVHDQDVMYTTGLFPVSTATFDDLSNPR